MQNFRNAISSLMNNIEIPNNFYSNQLLSDFEKDQKFIIELREASNIFLEKSVETYYDFYFKGKRGSQFNCIFFYFPEPRQSDVGLFIEDNLVHLYLKADHNVIETEEKNIFKMTRSFVPENIKAFSTDELDNIKKIYLKAIYKTAEKVF